MIDNKEIASLRRNYSLQELSEDIVLKSPFDQFKKWLNEALNSSIIDPNAMTLATCNKDMMPSTRIVLLKGITDSEFIFYTNYDSKKGKDLSENPNASLNFFWRELERQVNIQGNIEKASYDISKIYFDSRPYESKIAAWASEQSKEIKDRNELEESFLTFKNKYSENEVPLPEFWGGYSLKPIKFEFWQGRENRLHDRICYIKLEENWKIIRLAP